jgi:hypothetical protein
MNKYSSATADFDRAVVYDMRTDFGTPQGFYGYSTVPLDPSGKACP